MTKFLLGALAIALVLALLPGPGSTQVPNEFSNLQILPEDISKGELMGIMRGMAGALGTRCWFCHVPGENKESLEGMDFVSDENEKKVIAREMMRMTQEINLTFMAKAVESPLRVECVTCHHGVTKPAQLKDVLWDAAEEGGVEAVSAKYRELRETYHGGFSYDFNPGPLNTLAEEMAEEGELEQAIGIMDLNLEFHPDNAYCYLLKGQIQAQAGDKAGAIASMEKAIELEPENAWAKRLLERVQGMED